MKIGRDEMKRLAKITAYSLIFSYCVTMPAVSHLAKWLDHKPYEVTENSHSKKNSALFLGFLNSHYTGKPQVYTTSFESNPANFVSARTNDTLICYLQGSSINDTTGIKAATRPINDSATRSKINSETFRTLGIGSEKLSTNTK